jgi:hypothetical protein
VSTAGPGAESWPATSWWRCGHDVFAPGGSLDIGARGQSAAGRAGRGGAGLGHPLPRGSLSSLARPDPAEASPAQRPPHCL